MYKMLRATYTRYSLHFRQPAGTSRGVLRNKETWFIKIWDEMDPSIFGLGECAVFRGLSYDDSPEYEKSLRRFCEKINDFDFLNEKLSRWPSILFGI